VKAAPLPPNEEERLAALRRTQLLDSLPEGAFDDLTRIASQIAGTPIALVSLVDEHRQWFKARIGIDAHETPRDLAFCAHAILAPEPFVVHDACADERFHDNPFVAGDPYVRFYAGMPLTDPEGHALGTLCVIDRIPRSLPPATIETLQALARTASTLIELRRKSLEIARLAQEAIKRADEVRLQSELLDAAHDMIFVKDPEHRLLFWNRGAERVYGRSRDEVLGRVAHEVLRTEFPKPLGEIQMELLRSGHWEGEIVHHARDGSRVEVESRWVLRRDIHGAPVAILALNHDVTHKREVQRMKDEFVSIVSHELRTPLTAIRGALGLLEGGIVGELPGEANEMVRIARTNSDRLIRLVNDILDLEKMEAGKLELHPRELAVADLVAGVVESLAGMANENGVALAVDVEPNLRIAADEDRAVQLLTNLVSNAIKFSPPETRVRIEASSTDRRSACIRVRDQGPGIAQDQIGRLFQKFHQVDASDRRARGGTGLGLAISKAIAEQHGGRIGVDSVLGEGATFWVELPIAHSAKPPSVVPTSRRLVLVVDPHGHLSKTFAKVFAEEGCVVARAVDLEEAERWIDSAHPVAVIVDVGVSDAHVLELVSRACERFGVDGAPTIILTGRSPGEAPILPLAVEWIGDPLDDGRLRHALRWGRRDDARARVLLIEDDDALRAIVAARLRALGVDVSEARDGAEGIERARAEAPDLIVLDLGLPREDGFAVVAQLRRERARSTPLVVYSARDLGMADRQALSLGLTRWLTKARTSEEDLVGAVRELLNGLLPS
jgi:PAS domain S-box-containing protein